MLPGSGTRGAGIDLGAQVLENAWAKLGIVFEGNTITYEVTLPGSPKTFALTKSATRRIKSGLVADIRFFPRRSGIFNNKKLNGQAAWKWIRENCGIAVIDHGFRMRPFGFENDDWLLLNQDAAHNQRDWRSPISLEEFPISSEIRARPGDNPALNIPSTFQLVGAVFLESSAGSAGKGDLIPAMDREGYLVNESYKQLVDVVRGGIEYLALVDKQEITRREEERAAAAAASVRSDFRAAIKTIENSPTLTQGDKTHLVEHYAGLATKLEEVEEYGRDARRRLQVMGLLGVIAGFMTHESARILDGLERVVERLRKIAQSDPALAEELASVERGYQEFRGHVEYTSLFIHAARKEESSAFKSRPQINRIIEKFGLFARERNIAIEVDVQGDVVVSSTPVTVYSGVLLNLYTNALKAIVAREHRPSGPHLVFRGWNEGARHIVELSDKGVGIAPEIRQRVFDPLFTTTSDLNNPLGSGMGLGLSLVKEVMTSIGGKVAIVDPPGGYSTCFRVEFKGTTK